MLISLRNSGAAGIQFYKVVDPHQLMEIITVDKEHKDDVHTILLKPINLDSFVLDPNKVNVLLLKHDNGYSSNDKLYEIFIETTDGRFRLWYNKGRPDFFKRLFKYCYPEIANEQVEELV